MRAMKHIILLISVLLLQACENKDNGYDASGTFESAEITVSSEASGKIMQLDIQEGMQVESAQLLGYVDSVQLFLKKKQMEASLKAVLSRRPESAKQVASLEEQITAAKREKQRIQNLLAANAANQKQLDDISSQVLVLEKQLVALKSTLQITNAGITDESSVIEIQIAQLEDQLRKSRITSPIKGTILVRYTEAGELATPGKPLFKVADLERMFLRAYITADQLTQMKIGQQVTVNADFGEKQSRTYNGTITWISDKAEFTPKTIQTRNERANLVYAVKIAVPNDGYLKIGMYGQMKVQS
jgi:HlyD family secretion protein